MAVGDWTFETPNAAASFDTHVRGQLPWYDMATDAVALVAGHYIPHRGIVYDIGCGTGNVGRALEGILTTRNADFLPIDRSAEMCARYSGPGMPRTANIAYVDIEPFDVAVCMLALMLLPPEHQALVLRRLMDAMKDGGAVVLLEKMVGCGGYPQTIMQRLTFAGKVAMGTDADAILQKEFSLIGVQRPVSEQMIHETCPNAVRFWKYGEFEGLILQK